MRIIDEVKIIAKSGDGGNGSNSFRSEKYVEFGGPDGGNGGRGGNILLIADKSLNTLVNFRHKKSFEAESGKNGRGKTMTGRSGEDVILRVPVGTEVLDETSQVIIFDLSKDGQVETLIRGGRGGAGNHCFKSSINQAPKSALPGENGDITTIWLKLKILSDVGIIGMPNAGKSSLLSIISNAKPRIADFPFTTLSPNLGVVDIRSKRELVFCDIPGLIEGAHIGHGLGDKFLKHVERCKILVHLIDISDDIIKNFEIVSNEISSYSEKLIKKPMIIVFNKMDLITQEEMDIKLKDFLSYLAKSDYLKSTDWLDYLFDIKYTKSREDCLIKKSHAEVNEPSGGESVNAEVAEISAEVVEVNEPSGGESGSAEVAEISAEIVEVNDLINTKSDSKFGNLNTEDLKDTLKDKLIVISTFSKSGVTVLLDEVLRVHTIKN